MRINQKGKLEIMKTYIAIDQPELLENIKINLEKTNKITIVGTANNGNDCLKFFNQRTCDLLIIDLMLSLIHIYYQLKVVMLFMISFKLPILVFLM